MPKPTPYADDGYPSPYNVPPTVSSPPAGVASGLKAYWKFDNDLTDSSGNGKNLTDLGASYITGHFAQAMRGGGSLDPHGLLSGPLASTDWTISGWFKKPPFGGGASVLIQTSSGATDTQILLYHGGCSVSDSVNGVTVVTSASSVNGFNHLVAKAESGTLKLYLAGVQVDSRSLSAFTTNIGAYLLAQAGGPFQNGLDDTAIWNRALTDQEISDIFSAAGDLSTLL